MTTSSMNTMFSIIGAAIAMICFPIIREWYADLWDSINGKSYSWENNDWVWVIEFKVLTTTGVTNRQQEVAA